MSDAELIRLKDALILALAEKLAIVAEHLGRLSERPEVRGKISTQFNADETA